ncbi:MFS general substrate transporter [Dichomitus squalens]|uniref:MFS general substrate transporter n=1 Tax=Dichomitus squalens TaxID=114155 RepID=A0A4Q9PU82_9APHY|nr:MFS general substrate transporter [Dichomitus squalens]TBU58087.1 MFS general substrate transporter [Dichomitus squalens]
MMFAAPIPPRGTSLRCIMDVEVAGKPIPSSSYEMSVMPELGDSHPGTPATSLSAQSSIAALRAADPQEGANVQELPPVDRGFGAWMFCASAFITEMMIWGFSFSYGIFQEYYTSHPPFSSASTVSIAAVGTVSLAFLYGENFFLFFFVGRYPDFLRVSMWVGLGIYFVSLFASSFATQVWQLILLQGAGVGIGGGIVYLPIIKLLPEWFSERRGLASGLIFSGTALGGFVFPLLLNALLTNIGLRWTLRLWAIGTTVLCGIAMLGMRSRLPVPKYSAVHRRPKLLPGRVDFLRSTLFWSVAITNMLQGLSYFPVSLYIATFTKGLSNQLTATSILSLFNVSAVVGQITIGHLSDRFPYPMIMLFSAVGSGLGAFLLWGFADKVVYLYFFAFIFGSLSGGFSSTWTNSAAECAGSKPEFIGLAFCGVSFVKGISAVIGPVISGFLLQAGKGSTMGHGFGRFGYGAVEIFVGSCAFACGVGSIVIALARKQRVEILAPVF